MTAQNLWNEAAQLLNHAGSRPKPGRLPTRRGASIALRHTSIRHSDVLLLVRVEGGWAVDRRLEGRPSGASARFHLTAETFIK